MWSAVWPGVGLVDVLWSDESMWASIQKQCFLDPRQAAELNIKAPNFVAPGVTKRQILPQASQPNQSLILDFGLHPK